jgi:outer membrane protein assembly factor BamB
MRIHPLLAFALLLCAAAPSARADDWPQWLGPKRDGVWREEGLLKAFPKEGLKVRWRVPVAAGYSSPAVAGGRVFVTDRVPAANTQKPADPFQRVTLPGVERVLCFNEADGTPLWKHEYDCPYTVSYASGPRAIPTVDGERVYTLGAEGDLKCLEAATGHVVWSKKLSGENAPTPMWGFAGHPLIDGDRLICLTSGKDAVATAFNKKTGEVLWTALSAKDPGYSPPTIYDAGGARQLIIWHTEGVNGLDPATGKVYWTVPFGPANNGVTIMTPRLLRDEKLGDLLFVSTQYEGSLMLKLAKDDQGRPGATILWKRAGTNQRSKEALHILMSTPVLRDGHVYGINARGEMRCLNAANGDLLWEDGTATFDEAGPQSWVTAFLTPIGEKGTRHVIANEHGDLILADLTPQGYKEVSRTHLLDPTNTDAHRPALWCHPAYANRCVFWRNDKELICADMANSP